MYNMEIYISNSMLCSINDKLEKFLVKDVFYRTCFAILHSIFNGMKRNNCFYVVVVVSNNIAFVFDLT